MKLTYKLSNADFLTHQLYIASKSRAQKRKRFRSRLVVPVIYLAFSVYSYLESNNPAMIIGFVVLSILWYLFYPNYSRWKYKKHYQKHIEEYYKNKVGREVSFTFGEFSVDIKNASMESIADGTEFVELIELGSHFFIKLTTDDKIIIPKRSISDESEFKRIIIGYGALYVDELNWEWK